MTLLPPHNDGELVLPVVQAVADAEGVDPTDLGQPLGEVVDPDALDRLVHNTTDEGADLQVQFHYQNHDVTVHQDGCVDVQKHR